MKNSYFLSRWSWIGNLWKTLYRPSGSHKKDDDAADTAADGSLYGQNKETRGSRFAVPSLWKKLLFYVPYTLPVLKQSQKTENLTESLQSRIEKINIDKCKTGKRGTKL